MTFDFFSSPPPTTREGEELRPPPLLLPRGEARGNKVASPQTLHRVEDAKLNIVWQSEIRSLRLLASYNNFVNCIQANIYFSNEKNTASALVLCGVVADQALYERSLH